MTDRSHGRPVTLSQSAIYAARAEEVKQHGRAAKHDPEAGNADTADIYATRSLQTKQGRAR